MKLKSRKLIWNTFPNKIEIISMHIQMLTNILINIRISILSQYILSMIYVKAALSLSMCFLAPSLSYFPFLWRIDMFYKQRDFGIHVFVSHMYVYAWCSIKKLLMKCQLILLEREQQEMILVWYQLYPRQCRLIK